MNVRIIGHSASTGNDVYDLVVDGEQYKYETWSTENSSGATWYDATGIHPVDDPIAEDDEAAFNALIDTFVQLYYPLWNEKVEPILTEMVTTIISRLDQASICARCGMRIWQDRGSWVDVTDGDGCEDEHTHSPLIEETA